MVTATKEATTTTVDELKATATRLKGDWERASAHVTAITVEAAALPGRKNAAILSGDIAEYAAVLDRERLIEAEIQIGTIAAARAKVDYCRAEAEWARSNREYRRAEAERIGRGSGFIEGMPKGIAADNEAENSRAIVSAMSAEFSQAQRQLDSVIQQAQTRR
jgi:hypothetical protein